MAERIQERISAEQYYALPEYEQHDLIQLIDGQVVIGMPPIPKHQFIVVEIIFLLRMLANQKGGRVATSPIEVYLDEYNIYEPDVLYIAPDSRCEIGEKRLTGAPDLVVEVLSPSTAKHDRSAKYRAYERHGVREYWIVDPAHETLEVWALKDAQFQRQGAYAPGTTFKSSVLDTEVDVTVIFNV
jgi:Uma2 family endonuclease